MPALALQNLLEHPRRFLERHPLRIAGTQDPSGVLDYFMDAWAPNPHPNGPLQRPGTVLGTWRNQNAVGFQINPGRVHANGARFRAHSVQMVDVDDVNQLVHNPYVIHGGPNIMVTGRLTGCTFTVDDLGNGDIACAHLRPAGDASVALHDAALQLGVSRAYGRRDYEHEVPGGGYDRSVTIVGVRRNGQWKIYAQQADMMRTYSVVSVHRIWPT